ncbi:hypothetical protein C8R47DRAFT_312732 [Mycena vitilis]|nr:hypothetical protein C8R47DRAFT_312732 [Mycena vitilis]
MCMEFPTHSCSIPNFAAPLLLLSCQRRIPTHSCTKNLRSNLHKFKRTRRQSGCGWSAPAHIELSFGGDTFCSDPRSTRGPAIIPRAGDLLKLIAVISIQPTQFQRYPRNGPAADGPHLHQTVLVATVPAGVLVRLERGPAAILVEIASHGCGWSAPAPNDNGLLCIGTISVGVLVRIEPGPSGGQTRLDCGSSAPAQPNGSYIVVVPHECSFI